MGFIIFGVAAVALGAFFLYAHKSRRENSESYCGTVIGMLDKMVVRSGITYKVYCPVVKYSNGSRDITAEHHNYMKSVNLNCHVGDDVLIFADPRMPKSFWFSDELTNVCYEAVAAFIAGGVLVAVGIFMAAAGI